MVGCESHTLTTGVRLSFPLPLLSIETLFMDPNKYLSKNHWDILVKEYSKYYGNKYTIRGKEYTFLGILHEEKDFRYFFWRMGDKREEFTLVSCTSNLEDIEREYK